MSKTWYGHHIETIKGEDYVLHKDYTEIQDKLYKCEKVLDKIKEYINHAQNYGTMAQVMPHLKPYVNGDDILELLEEIE